MSKIEGKQLRNLRLGASQEVSPVVGSINFNSTTDEIVVKNSSQDISFLGELSNTLTTTDATITTILTIPMVSDSSNFLKIYTEAIRTGGTSGAAGDGGVWERTLRVKNIAGIVTIMNPSSDFTSKDQAGWNISFVVSGTNILIQIKGANQNNINWKSSAAIRTIT